MFVGAAGASRMMSGRTGFRNRVSTQAASGIPPRGTRAPLPNKKIENNPMHSRRAYETKDLHTA
jgi:hypothetical protein